VPRLNFEFEEAALSPGAVRFLPYLIVLALGVLGISWEIIQTNDGLGIDGLAYAKVAQIGEIPNAYYLTRSLAPLIVGAFHPTSIPFGFQLLNLVCALICCFLWQLTADQLKLDGGRWLGFLGLFLNFQAKQFYFMPVLVDALALTFAMLMLWLHVSGRRIGVLIVSIASAFVWPVGPLAGAALLAFGPSEDERRVGINPLLWSLLIVPVYVVLMLVHSPLRSFATGIPSFMLATLAILSLAYFKRPSPLAILAALPVPVIWLLGKAGGGGGTPGLMAGYVLNPQSGQFFLPFVSLAVYWGPLVVMVALHWRSVAREARRLGIAWSIILGIPFALTTEPRHFLFAWPFLVAAAAKAVDACPRRFIVLSVLWSQFWLWINYAPWSAGTADYQQFPKQLFWGHYGFWMNFPVFAVQLTLVVLTALILSGFTPRSIRERGALPIAR
jgi:hypothetical protein